MVLRTALVGAILILNSVSSYGESEIDVRQNISSFGLIGGALPPQKRDKFESEEGIPATYSAQLNYSTGPIIDILGNPIPQGYANTSISYDLPRGEFGFYADSLLPSLGGPTTAASLMSSTSIEYVEGLTVHSPSASASAPSFITFKLQLDGEFNQLPALYPEEGMAGTVATLFSATNITQGATGIVRSSNSCGGDGQAFQCEGGGTPAFAFGGFATSISGLKDGGYDEMMVRLPLYHETTTIGLFLNMNALSIQMGTDFSHTAKLFVDAPGSTFVSDSGNFMTAAIPEPETYAMLLAGLGVIGFLARRKKRLLKEALNK